MKIGIVMTGGTIACVEKDGVLTPVEQNFAAGYETRVWGNALSEQATLSTYCDIAAFVRGFDTVDGIVLTHGTDTLVYASSMLSYLLADFDKPVVIVSANYPLDDPRSNGRANLDGAFAALPKLASGVYVSYTNEGESTKIHLGCRLLPQSVFSDRVEGAESVIATVTKQGSVHIVRETPARHPVKVRGIQPAIYMTACYPTERFHVEEGSRAVIVTAYHSGTARSEAINLLARKTDVYLVGGLREYATYDSATKLIPSVHVLDNVTPPAAYCKAAIAYATSDPVEVMTTDICGEIF